MELFKYHFEQLENKTLYYNPFDDTYNNNGVKQHVAYPTFKKFIEELMKNYNSSTNILEVGTAASTEKNIGLYDVNSTYLFDNIVRKYGGHFWTCDIDNDKIEAITPKLCPASCAITTDGMLFLHTWSTKLPDLSANVYLDTCDISEPYLINANKCYNEYISIKSALNKDSLLLINNSPSVNYITKNYDEKNNCSTFIQKDIKNSFILDHKYQLLYKFN